MPLLLLKNVFLIIVELFLSIISLLTCYMEGRKELIESKRNQLLVYDYCNLTKQRLFLHQYLILFPAA